MSSGKCDLCEKVLLFGRNIRHKHSGRWERKAPKTSRKFRPNVQSKKMIIDGKLQRINICTRCIRTQMKKIILAN
ncbi:MAG: large subunit ribosomal protein L28 [Chloroflexi bacterium]|jgi:large subunit ribosomal protein L28|nr:MAG: large subunit ribosomal protein L28 [Chloroflexota bacterium]